MVIIGGMRKPSLRAEPKPPPPPVEPTRLYPIHYIQPGSSCGAGSALILPATAMVIAGEGELYCTRCECLITVDATTVAQAREAARADGFTDRPSTPGMLTPGMLPPEVRKALYLWTQLVDFKRATDDGTLSQAREAMDKAQGPMLNLGLSTGDPMTSNTRDGWLTPLGEAMAKLVAQPACPVATDPADIAGAKNYGAKLVAKAPKPRAAKPERPMHCVCGCSARAHAGVKNQYAGMPYETDVKVPVDIPCAAHGCARYRRAELPMEAK